MTAVNLNDYMTDAKGNLVPKTKVKEVDMFRDDVVRDLFALAEDVHDHLVSAKAHFFDEISGFCDVSFDKYGVRFGGTKGNVELTSFDGSLKITKQVSDVMTVDERIHVAKQLIDECLQEWTQDADDNLKAVINLAFKVDKKGNLSISRLRQLLQLDIDHPKWKKAMQAINDSIKVVDTCEYVRFSKRDEHGKYVGFSLDIASV